MTGESIRALFKDGVFIPQQAVSLDEGSTVEIIFRPSKVQSAVVTDSAQRQRIMDDLIASFKRNPIPVDAPHLIRDELHERR